MSPNKLRAFLAVFLAASVCAAASALDAAGASSKYPSVPKGVVLEGVATGIEPVNSIAYDARGNVFVINGAATYANPLEKAVFKEVLDAMAQHDHLGVSIRMDRTFFAYGRIPPNGRVARDLSMADRLFGGVVFAIREFHSGRGLPGNYAPQSVDASRRRILSAATFIFDNYLFARNAQGAYVCQDFTFDVEMVPVHKDRRAPDGGYVMDRDAYSRGDVEPADRANLQHLVQFKSQYMSLPEADRAAKIGEAAAFIRWVRAGTAEMNGAIRGGRVDLLQRLSAQMR